MTTTDVKRKLRDRFIDIQNLVVDYEATTAVGQAIVKQIADFLIKMAGHEKLGQHPDQKQNETDDPCYVFDAGKAQADCQKLFDRLEIEVFGVLAKTVTTLENLFQNLSDLKLLVKSPESERLCEVQTALGTIAGPFKKELGLKRALIEKMSLEVSDQLTDDQFQDAIMTVVAAWSHGPYVNDREVQQLKDLCLRGVSE